jgi:ethanolamine utilization protein EutM
VTATRPLVILEVASLGAALVVLDRVTKATPLELVQAELNDLLGYVLKLTGDVASLEAAAAEAKQTSEQLRAAFTSAVIRAPAGEAMATLVSPPEYQPLLDQPAVFFPSTALERILSDPPPAIGLIETQGFTAVFQAIDAAVKAADVRVLGKEKLGGGYVTVLIAGQTAAVENAISVARDKTRGLGTLIAAHVITAPSSDVIRLIPASPPAL